MDVPRRTLALILLLIPILLVGAEAHAADAEAIAKKYGALPTTQMMDVSPNGEMVAFRKVSDERDLILVVSLKKGEVIAGAELGDLTPYNLYFLNNRYVIMVGGERRRELGFKGEHNISTAFAIDITNNDMEQLLTPGDNIRRGQSGLGSIVGLSEDHEHVYMPAYVGESYDRSPRRSLMRVDISSPRSPRVHERGSDDTIDYFVDTRGEVLIREDFNDRSGLHEILVPEGNGWRAIYEKQTHAGTDISLLGLTPSRDQAVVIKDNDSTGRSDYYLMSLEDGSFSEPRFETADKDVESVITDTNRIVQGVRLSGLTPSYMFFDSSVDKRVKAFSERFPGHAVKVTSWSSDWSDVVFYVAGSQSSGDYYLASKGKAPRFLAASRPHIKSQQMHHIATTSYKARDGLKIPTLLTLPYKDLQKVKKLPAVIMPHGGPASYDRIRFDYFAQALADRGYLVIQPQFRGSAGFGESHYQAGQGEWGRRMQDDLSDAVANFTKSDMIDPDRVCIVGASYGGYAALAGGAFTPDLYRCVVSIAGVSDLNKMLDDDEDRHGRDHWVISYFERSIANGYFGEEGIEAVSPINSVNNYQAPVLLIHGEDDEVVPIEQSEDMLDALEGAEKSVSFIELDEENHYLMRGETRIQTMTHMLKFVDEHLAVPEKTASAH